MGLLSFTAEKKTQRTLHRTIKLTVKSSELLKKELLLCHMFELCHLLYQGFQVN